MNSVEFLSTIRCRGNIRARVPLLGRPARGRRHLRRWALLPASLIVAVTLACGREEPGTGEPPAEPVERGIDAVPAEPVAPQAPDEPDPVGGALGEDAGPSGEWTAGITDAERAVRGVATLVRVATGRHPDFDRVVLEFAEEVPGYHIEYIDRPVRQCGSGHEVPLEGDGWLAITVEPAAAHSEEGESTIRERERRPGLPVLLELKLTCDFEAQVQWVGGVASPNRYRVLVLETPPRLVVDIRH